MWRVFLASKVLCCALFGFLWDAMRDAVMGRRAEMLRGGELELRYPGGRGRFQGDNP